MHAAQAGDGQGRGVTIAGRRVCSLFVCDAAHVVESQVMDCLLACLLAAVVLYVFVRSSHDTAVSRTQTQPSHWHS